MSRDELQTLWQCAPDAPPEKGAEEMLSHVVERSRRFGRRIAVRNTIEVTAASAVAGLFTWFAFHMPTPLERIGEGIVAVSGLWIIFYLLRFGSAKTPDPDRDLTVYCRGLDQNYDRQIRLLRSVKYWYLLPPWAGLLILTIGTARRFAAQGRNLGPALIGFGVATAFFVLIWLANEFWGVRYLQRLKAELHAVMEGRR